LNPRWGTLACERGGVRGSQFGRRDRYFGIVYNPSTITTHATFEEKKLKTLLGIKNIYLSRKRILELLVIKRSGSELKRLLIFSSERGRDSNYFNLNPTTREYKDKIKKNMNFSILDNL
jgi:hypothetical protein